MAGAANLTTANTGTGSGMRRMKGAFDVPLAVRQAEFANIPGDGGIIAKLPRKSVADANFVLSLSPRDQVIENMVQGTSLYSLGEWDMSKLGGSKSLKDMILMASRVAANWESGSENTPGYENLLIASSYLDPSGDEGFANQREGKARFNGTTNEVTKLPWGESVLTKFGLAKGEAFSWFSEFPCVLEAFVGDNIIVAIPLTYTPKTAAKTKAFTFSTGAAVTVSSVDTTAKTATVSAAPASGAIVGLIYETSDVL
jgi:hypothetical protein